MFAIMVGVTSKEDLTSAMEVVCFKLSISLWQSFHTGSVSFRYIVLIHTFLHKWQQFCSQESNVSEHSALGRGERCNAWG